jgi:hypothetical protein
VIYKSFHIILYTVVTTGWTAGARFPAEGRDFSPFQSVHTYSGAHPDFYLIGSGGFYPGIKQQELKVDHSKPSSAEVKNGGVTSPLPHTSSWYGA